MIIIKLFLALLCFFFFLIALCVAVSFLGCGYALLRLVSRRRNPFD